MTLAAHEAGLGTCWIGAYEEDKVKEILGIPAGIKVVVLLPIGVPDIDGVPRPRKALEEIVAWERWS
jgi:nitroreductase